MATFQRMETPASKHFPMRFKHIHRERLVGHGAMCHSTFQKELAGTVAYQYDGKGSVKATLVVLNPHDVRPKKRDNKDVLIEQLRKALFMTALPLVELDVMDKSAAYLDLLCFVDEQLDAFNAENAPRERNTSRRKGRELAAERFNSGDVIVLEEDKFFLLRETEDLIPYLARKLNFPARVVDAMEDCA